MIRKPPHVGAMLLLIVWRMTVPAHAALPPELAAAVQQLRAQHSYSWEIINGDPGPVEQTIHTARGTVQTVQRNPSPHAKGRLSATGEMLIERDWSDGLKTRTLVAADGTMVTETPEGWLSRQEILEAIAEERLRAGGPSARMEWLPRAEAVDTMRPAEELQPFVDGDKTFQVSGDTYVCTLDIQVGNPANAADGGTQSVGNATITLHLVGGVLRDYEIVSEISRRAPRPRVSIMNNNDRIVVLSYQSVGRINVPDEARAKLKAAPPRSDR